MGICPVCLEEVPEAKNRNKVEKKFCSDKCRWTFSNRKKLDDCMDEIRQAVESILKRRGYLK